MNTKIHQHAKICEMLHEIYKKKNSDYGDSFEQTFDKLGIISAVTRISDKYNRLCSLATKTDNERQVKDESIKDTLLDMANYAIMTVIELEKDNTMSYDDMSVKAVFLNDEWRDNYESNT